MTWCRWKLQPHCGFAELGLAFRGALSGDISQNLSAGHGRKWSELPLPTGLSPSCNPITFREAALGTAS